DYQALLVLGGAAVATIVALWAVYRLRRKTNIATVLPAQSTANLPSTSLLMTTPSIANHSQNGAAQSKKQIVKRAGQNLFNSFTAVFAVFLAVASVSLASAVNMLPNVLLNAPFFVLALFAFVVSAFFMCRMLRKFVLAFDGAVSK